MNEKHRSLTVATPPSFQCFHIEVKVNEINTGIWPFSLSSGTLQEWLM